MKFKIAEIFDSIQGEGLLMGTPSTFVRLSGCNLRCIWCDTPYASWRPEGVTMDLDEIVSRRTQRNVVVTGGEPMIFENIGALCEGLGRDAHVTIETAGTVFRAGLKCDLMSISPKLANSTPTEDPVWRERHESIRLDRTPLQDLKRSYPYQLKFVVTGESDLAEIDEILAPLDADPARILLMPEGIEKEALRERMKDLAPICLTRGWRLCPRLHIELYGNTRGT